MADHLQKIPLIQDEYKQKQEAKVSATLQNFYSNLVRFDNTQVSPGVTVAEETKKGLNLVLIGSYENSQ